VGDLTRQAGDARPAIDLEALVAAIGALSPAERLRLLEALAGTGQAHGTLPVVPQNDPRRAQSVGHVQPLEDDAPMLPTAPPADARGEDAPTLPVARDRQPHPLPVAMAAERSRQP
jgi:hypothetical protein